MNNIDGFGTPPLKMDVYAQLANPPVRRQAPAKTDDTELSATQVSQQPHRFNGFKLFYHEDTGLMTPRDVLSLQPVPDVVVYE